jgi:hypothetical protein
MAHPSPQTIYDSLGLLEQIDSAYSAAYRELAQEVLADSGVSFGWRQAIADRLNQANRQLAQQTVDVNDSY